jgi:hypothetical protein
VNLATRTWFNDNLESRNYFVPGVIAILLALITLASKRKESVGYGVLRRHSAMLPLQIAVG